MKKVILSGILFMGLLSSCSQLGGAEGEDTIVTGAVPEALPNSKEMSDAMNLIVEKAGFSSIDEMEFFEINSSYIVSLIAGRDASVHFDATVVSKNDKNKLLNYHINFEEGTVSDGEEVVLTSGYGSKQEIVEGYDNFKINLFKSGDFPSFDKMDEMQKEALKNSGYKEGEQHLKSYSSGFNNAGRFETYIYVQNEKVRTMSKGMYFDKDGKLKK